MPQTSLTSLQAPGPGGTREKAEEGEVRKRCYFLIHAASGPGAGLGRQGRGGDHREAAKIQASGQGRVKGPSRTEQDPRPLGVAGGSCGRNPGCRSRERGGQGRLDMGCCPEKLPFPGLEGDPQRCVHLWSSIRSGPGPRESRIRPDTRTPEQARKSTWGDVGSAQRPGGRLGTRGPLQSAGSCLRIQLRGSCLARETPL